MHMKKSLICLLFSVVAALCFARGKQEVIVSESLPSDSRDVVVTIVNDTEADFSTLAISTKDVLADKSSAPVRLMFSVRSGGSKSIALENDVLYKLEFYDSKGHKFSKKTVLSDDGFQLFTQPWQKLIITEQDFEPQSAIDVFEVFFGMYGNETHEEALEKQSSVIIVNKTGEPVEYLSIVQDGISRTSNLAMGKGQSGVFDIKRNTVSDISLITRSQHVYTKAGLVFDSENVTVIFTSSDREIDAEKAASFVSSALGSITDALSMTTQAFASVFGRQDDDSEFEAVDGDSAADLADGASPADTDETADSARMSDTAPAADSGNETEEKSFWSRHFSWLPWID